MAIWFESSNLIFKRLESWGVEEASRPYFRKRLWGSWAMLRALITDKTLWKVGAAKSGMIG